MHGTKNLLQGPPKAEGASNYNKYFSHVWSLVCSRCIRAGRSTTIAQSGFLVIPDARTAPCLGVDLARSPASRVAETLTGELYKDSLEHADFGQKVVPYSVSPRVLEGSP